MYNNPIKFTDPSGNIVIVDDAILAALFAALVITFIVFAAILILWAIVELLEELWDRLVEWVRKLFRGEPAPPDPMKVCSARWLASRAQITAKYEAGHITFIQAIGYWKRSDYVMKLCVGPPPNYAIPFPGEPLHPIV